MIPGIAGPLLLGLLAGWAAYTNLFRQAEAMGLSSIAAVLWANDGAALAGGFGGRQAFGWYAIGLFTAFEEEKLPDEPPEPQGDWVPHRGAYFPVTK